MTTEPEIAEVVAAEAAEPAPAATVTCAAPAVAAEPESPQATLWPGPAILMAEHPEWAYLAEPGAPAGPTIIDPELWAKCGGSAAREPTPLPKRTKGPMAGPAEDVPRPTAPVPGRAEPLSPDVAGTAEHGPGHHHDTAEPVPAASDDDEVRDSADAQQHDSEAMLARWGTARCFPCSRDRCTECERGTCGCAHGNASGCLCEPDDPSHPGPDDFEDCHCECHLIDEPDDDGEVMPDGSGRDALRRERPVETAPRPDLSDHAPSAAGDERQEGPGRPSGDDEQFWAPGDEADLLSQLIARHAAADQLGANPDLPWPGANEGERLTTDSPSRRGGALVSGPGQPDELPGGAELLAALERLHDQQDQQGRPGAGFWSPPRDDAPGDLEVTGAMTRVFDAVPARRPFLSLPWRKPREPRVHLPRHASDGP